MLTVKIGNFVVRNKGMFEANALIAGPVSRFLRGARPLNINDIRFNTRFAASYALTSERNLPEFKRVMRRLESYLGAGPFGPKKYWEYPWALANMRLDKGMKVLDAGCGRSPVQFLLSDFGMNVTGVDLFEGVKWHGIDRQLAKRLSAKIDYYKTSLETLPFSDDTFDRVACLSVLEHCRRVIPENDKLAPQTAEDKALQKKIVSELVRVVKPGGIVVLTVDLNIPRSDCLSESNIDVKNVMEIPAAELAGPRSGEAFPFEAGFDAGRVIHSGDIYIENYLDTLQTSIGVVLKKK